MYYDCAVIEAQHVATESIKKSQEHLDIISRIITSLAADVSKDERLKTSLQEYNEVFNIVAVRFMSSYIGS